MCGQGLWSQEDRLLAPPDEVSVGDAGLLELGVVARLAVPAPACTREKKKENTSVRERVCEREGISI